MASLSAGIVTVDAIMKKKTCLPIIAVLFPLLLMLIWLATLYMVNILGTEVRFKITGYDPRDLLSGHYLRYTVDYGIPPLSLCSGESFDSLTRSLTSRSASQCLCFAKPNIKENNKAFWAGNCEDRPQECDLYLEGRCEYGRFLSGIERYYFPEQFKKLLTFVPEKSSVIVKIFRGKGIVQKIEVDGLDIVDYAKQIK